VGLVSADAVAADGVKLSIGGWYHAAAGCVAGEDFSSSSRERRRLRDYAFKQNVGISFSGESVLDNGSLSAPTWSCGQTQRIRSGRSMPISAAADEVQFGDQDSA
jgi:hypothetical protein